MIRACARAALAVSAGFAVFAGFAACADHILIGAAPGDAAAPPDGPITGGTAADAAPATGGAPGLEGSYFDNLELAGLPKVVRVDPALDMIWDAPGGPAPGVPNAFSARWRGALEVPTSDTYTFVLESDDGSRLWIGGALLIDQWNGGANAGRASVFLDAATRHELRAELLSYGGNANINLSWSSARIPQQKIPAERFSRNP